MSRRILLIDGHPDARDERFVHALTRAYWNGARAAGHEVKCIIVSELDFPLLKTADDFSDGVPCRNVCQAQQWVTWADHIVILFPLWLGTMPAMLKAFLEQVFRPRFAFRTEAGAHFPVKLLKGKSARIVVTMGMPAPLYRLWFRAHGVKSLQRSILGFSGLSPVHVSLIGGVESIGAARRGIWLSRVEQQGRRAA